MQKKHDIIILAGQDEVRKYRKIIQSSYDHIHDFQYKDSLIKPYKPLLELKGKPIIQHVIDEISIADKGTVAKELGMQNSIGSITIVGRKSLQPVIEQRNQEIKFVLQGKNISQNVWKAFCSMFTDNQALPEIDRAYYYISRIEKKGIKKLGNKIRARAEIFAELANAIRSNHKGIISIKDVNLVMSSKIDELNYRRILIKEKDQALIKKSILSNPEIEIKNNQVRFKRFTSYEYFLEFYDRLEKEVTILTCDIPILNLGLIVFLRQCSQVKADFKFGLTTEEYLIPYYEPKNKKTLITPRAYKEMGNFDGIVRPFMILEKPTRVLNLTQLKPNKIGNRRLIEKGFGFRKMRDLFNVLIVAIKAPRHARGMIIKAVIAYIIIAYNLNKFKFIKKYYEHIIHDGLTYDKIDEISSKVLRCTSKIILSPYGAISLDTDHISDIEKLERYLEKWKQYQDKIDYSKYI